MSKKESQFAANYKYSMDRLSQALKPKSDVTLPSVMEDSVSGRWMTFNVAIAQIIFSLAAFVWAAVDGFCPMSVVYFIFMYLIAFLEFMGFARKMHTKKKTMFVDLTISLIIVIANVSFSAACNTFSQTMLGLAAIAVFIREFITVIDAARFLIAFRRVEIEAKAL